MYIEKAHHRSSYMFMFLGALVFGTLLGVFLPETWITQPIIIISNISSKIILYFTIPYLFFSLLISSYELSKNHNFLYIIAKAIKSGIIIMSAIVAVSMVIFIVFVPYRQNISLITKKSEIVIISVSDIISNIFSISWDVSAYASQVLLIPFFILAIVIGVNAKNILNARHPLLESCSGLRAINLKILENLLPWYSFAAFFMIVRNVSSFSSFNELHNFLILIIFLIGLALALIFVVYPLLFNRFNIPTSYTIWCKQIIPAIAMAFAGGNMASASVPLLYVENNKQQQQKVSDTSIALSFIFSRAGTAVTIALSYIMINKIYTAFSLTLPQMLLVFTGSIIISLVTNAISSPIILSGVATLYALPSTVSQNLYEAIIPLGIILHCIASVIDIATCGFIKLYLSNKIHVRNTSLGFPFQQQ